MFDVSNSAELIRVVTESGLLIGNDVHVDEDRANGHQNYTNWEKMRQDLPFGDTPWSRTEGGVFKLNADYWAKDGGILEPLPRIEALFANV